MEQLKIETGGRRKTILFRAEVPTMVKPIIKETKIIDGVTFYICRKGKTYAAKAFDKMFGVVRGNILKKGLKRDIVKFRNGNAVAI